MRISEMIATLMDAVYRFRAQIEQYMGQWARWQAEVLTPE
jgi:hypothetical protein